MSSLNSNDNQDLNNNWNLAVLVFVILVLFFIWIHKFLGTTDQFDNLITQGMFSSDGTDIK